MRIKTRKGTIESRCARQHPVNGRLSLPVLSLPPLSKIVLYANKVGPYFNPQETYHYYSLPVCRPSKVSGGRGRGAGRQTVVLHAGSCQVNVGFYTDPVVYSSIEYLL